MKSGKTLITILTSTVTAAIAGALLAPQKGSTMRRKISEKSRQYTGAVTGMFRGSAGRVTRQLRGGDKEAGEAVKKGTKTKKKEASGKNK